MKFLTTIILFLAPMAFMEQIVHPGQMPEKVAIFAIESDEQTRIVDPIVIVEYGHYQAGRVIPSLNEPLSDDYTESDLKETENYLYKSGKPISVFWGGEKLGTATFRGYDSENKDKCDGDLSTEIIYNSTGNPSLASNTESEIPGHVSTRHIATSGETSILRDLAIKWLREYGLEDQLLQHGILQQVISTKLRETTGNALIGRFDVESKRAIHRLFVVAERDHGQYVLTLTKLDIQRDLEDGTDRNVCGYVDQLDINNDGADEIITKSEYYESRNYTVWKCNPGSNHWYIAYEGGGGGC